MVTMLDVAKKAGVSKSTVSRVLNSKNVVSKAVTDNVFKAIEETGYRPNLLARQMATQKSNLIGLVVTNGLYNGPYFAELVYKAAAFSEQHQHQLILADGKNSAEGERQAIKYLLDMKCAGLVVYPQYLNSRALFEIIDECATPIAIINRKLPSHQHYSITVDHFQSGLELTEYLIQQGHRDIAFIQGKAGSASGSYRFSAYQQQLQSHGIKPDPALIVRGAWTPESGYLAAQTLVQRGLPCSAILAGNDDMAIGAIKALQEAGYQLPDDISIAGFDNAIMGRYISPSLTTMNVPIDRMVERAILQVMGSTLSPAEHCIDGELIIRDSVIRATARSCQSIKNRPQ